MVHHRKYPPFSLTKRCIYKRTLTLTLGIKSHETLPSIQGVTSAPVKYGVTMCNGLGGDAFTKHILLDIGTLPWEHGHMKHCPLLSSCDLCTSTV